MTLMNLFRRRPLVMQAVQYTPENREDIIKLIGPMCLHSVAAEDGRYWETITLGIPTPEGVMQVNIGDWIIKGVKNEWYPCKGDIFEELYEPVSHHE